MADTGGQKTSLSRRWSIKMIIMIIALVGFGGWGLYDALVAYPNRGASYADWAKWQYLQAAKDANDRESFGVFAAESSVPQPVEELARLRENEEDLRITSGNRDSSRSLRATMELARLEWLTSLERINRLTPEETLIENPQARLAELTTKWSGAASQPSALKFYDIPSQWLIVIVCWSFAAYMLALFASVASKTYRYDPATHRLTLPGGKSIVPSDLEELDKRKWDKFIVFLVTTPNASEVPGARIKCDTYRYAKLEDWILEMERVAFPEIGEEATDPDAETIVAGSPEGDAPDRA